ncbi:V-type ATP synthase subunit I [Paludibacter sp. 221]|uniref:V-type ATP synthase subunit I n=1 Tax=Paludibacter sp. 221 TaxID=2302939 RepID=UPI0013D896A9|nr:V-type ATPase 116kDa subunit family protein [Paludibacter sp. 221]
MKKYTFLVYHKQYLEFLERIKEIGVLHIIEKPEGIAENDALREKMQIASRIKAALKSLEFNRPKDAVLTPADKNRDGLAVLEEVEDVLSRKEHLQQKVTQTEKERDRMEVWGDFDHARINELRKSGYVLNFFATPLRKFDQEWEVLYNAFEVDRVGSTVYFVTVTRPGEKIEIDADHITLSEKTARELDVDIVNLRSQLEKANEEIKSRAISDYNTLKEAEVDVLTAVAFDKVVLNTHSEADDRVKLIEGWCPEGSEEELNNYLESTDVYYETALPTETDKVPIKLKNNKFTKMFEFIGELYDLPNYHERDLTPYFAPFYVIFFGFCLGDAGYGLLFLLLGLFARMKMKNPVFKSVMSLVAVLGGVTVLVGLLCGTVFGISLIDSPVPWLQKFQAYMLDSDKLFYNALILGVVQILFGMILKWTGEIKRTGFASSLPTLGWLLILMGCGGTLALSTFDIVSAEFAKWGYIVFGSLGGLCVFLLNNLKRNPLINVGSGLWDTYNMVTGLLGDVLSYIRLFALGLSGGVMGFVFNDLGLSMGESIGIPVVSQLVTVFILLFGHGINIFIAALGSFVHPMRLTFVEFYKNAGFEGGGKKYRPFAKYEEETKVL